jgi:hypothetical protein
MKTETKSKKKYPSNPKPLNWEDIKNLYGYFSKLEYKRSHRWNTYDKEYITKSIPLFTSFKELQHRIKTDRIIRKLIQTDEQWIIPGEYIARLATNSLCGEYCVLQEVNEGYFSYECDEDEVIIRESDFEVTVWHKETLLGHEFEIPDCVLNQSAIQALLIYLGYNVFNLKNVKYKTEITYDKIFKRRTKAELGKPYKNK